MGYQGFLDFIKQVVFSFFSIGDWLTTPFIQLNGVDVSPLFLISFGGIVIFLGVAIVKWVVS